MLRGVWVLFLLAIEGDRPLVVQFAAHNAKDFADAAELVAPFADGVDLNCGCPQRYYMCVHAAQSSVEGVAIMNHST